MNMVKWLVLVAVLAVGYRYVAAHRASTVHSHDAASGYVSSFVSLPPISNVGNTGVTVFAAEGCPEEASQRADRLVEQLTGKGISVHRMSHVDINIPQADPAVAQTVMSVMNGEVPIVFVRGRAKANPTVQEVVSEYASEPR